jgi:hypothetical protein
MFGLLEDIIPDFVQPELVVSRNNDFVFVGQQSEELPESRQFGCSGEFGEVAAVDEDIGRR